jgi:hypothetical protein
VLFRYNIKSYIYDELNGKATITSISQKFFLDYSFFKFTILHCAKKEPDIKYQHIFITIQPKHINIRIGPVVRISRFHRDGRGSIPRCGKIMIIKKNTEYFFYYPYESV